jgi:hypothetical protein
MWKLLIHLILAIDMARHFTILEEARQFRTSWTKSEEGKYAMMQLLMKAADVSNVAWTFEWNGIFISNERSGTLG